MNEFLIVAIVLNWIVVSAGCWLAWQLLRQNGRILLRLDELEQRLDEVEFGEPDDEPPDEFQGRARHSVRAEPEQRNNGAQGTDAPYPDDRASSRFSNRSLTRSRIKRNGLKAGNSAPSFRLPRLDGGELSLEELRGKRVLLVFSDPHCGPCQMLAPELEKFYVENGTKARSPSPRPSPPGEGEPPTGVEVVMISRGEPKENRVKPKEYGLTFPVLLQQRWEISRLYAMFATPVAYLIDETGIITHDVAVGVEPILELLMKVKEPLREPTAAPR